jgi:hypothetical protein
MKSKADRNIVETSFRADDTGIYLQGQTSKKLWDCITDHGRVEEKPWNHKHSKSAKLQSPAAAAGARQELATVVALHHDWEWLHQENKPSVK